MVNGLSQTKQSSVPTLETIYAGFTLIPTIAANLLLIQLRFPIVTELGNFRMKRVASIEPEHLRAICDEIGERLRMLLDRSASPASEYLMSLVAQLDHPIDWSPSIAPSLDYEFEDSADTSNDAGYRDHLKLFATEEATDRQFAEDARAVGRGEGAVASIAG